MFGLGIWKRRLEWRMAGGIVTAWVLTLPAAALAAALVYLLLTGFN